MVNLSSNTFTAPCAEFNGEYGVLSNDDKNKKNNAGGDIISYRCNIWIKYK